MQQTEEDGGMAGGCLTHGAGGESEAIVQLVTQTEPSSFSSLRATCVARTCLAILEMRPVRFIRETSCTIVHPDYT